MTTPNDDPPTWAEHADDLRGEQRALAMIRAVLADDDDIVNAAIDEYDDLVRAACATSDFDELELFQSGLALIAIRFGQRLHGDDLDVVLADMQRALAEHIASYNPDDTDQQ